MRGVRGSTLLLTVLLIAIAFALQGCPSLIANRPPDAEFTPNPTSGKAPLTVEFDASASSDPDKDSPDGDIVSYEWEFGDGSTGNGVKVDHTYTSGGRFTVTLTVSDGDGATDTASQAINVSSTINASINVNTSSGKAPLTVDFDASDSVDSSGVNAQSIASYEWDFGDGYRGTGESESHVYFESGTYQAKLTVTDDEGNMDTTSVAIEVKPFGPTSLYWTDVNKNKIEKCDISNCTATRSQLLGDKSDNPRGIFATSNRLYWAATDTSKLLRCDIGKCNSTITELATVESPVDLTLRPNTIYWTTSTEKVFRCQLGNCKSTKRSLITGMANATGITATSQRLYWLDAGGPGNIGEVRRCEIGNCANTATVLVDTSVVRLRGVEVYKDDIYWTDAGNDTIKRCEKDSCASTVNKLATIGGISNPFALELVDGTLFYSDNYKEKIQRCDPSNCSITLTNVITSGLDFPASISAGN